MISSCSSSSKDDVEAVVEESAEELYLQGMDALNSSKYKTAVSHFEDVERVYPYSKWATKAQIMAAYANYKDEEYDSAVLALDRFIKLHPGNSDIEYAYYLKGLSYYNQISIVTRDQAYTKLAHNSLAEVIARFPGSEYASDAKIKLDLVKDHLAGKEMEIGRFYLKKEKPLAAIGRFKAVLDVYETTSHAPEALHRLVEAYVTLGVIPEAKRYAAVLGHNFPGSKWYQYSYDLLKGDVDLNRQGKALDLASFVRQGKTEEIEEEEGEGKEVETVEGGEIQEVEEEE